MPKYLRDAIGNVSCFIQFTSKGEVTVTGWGSGVNETYLDPEPVPFVNDEVIERYRNKVAIVPKPVVQKSAPQQPAAAIVPESVTPSPLPPQPRVDAKERVPLGGPLHRETQERIQKVAVDKGFKADIEKATVDSKGFVDVSLEKGGVRIACEVSVTTSATWEAKNVLKCIKAGYDHVVVICSEPKAIPALTAQIRAVVPVIEQHRIKILPLDEFFSFLTHLAAPVDPSLGKPGKLAGNRLDLKEAAEFFGKSRSTLYRWANEGRVPSIRVGRNYEFDRDVLVLLGKHDLAGKRKALVNLEPVKIEKPKSRTKKQQDSRYRKMLKLD